MSMERPSLEPRTTPMQLTRYRFVRVFGLPCCAAKRRRSLRLLLCVVRGSPPRGRKTPDQRSARRAPHHEGGEFAKVAKDRPVKIQPSNRVSPPPHLLAQELDAEPFLLCGRECGCGVREGFGRCAEGAGIAAV